MREADVSRAEKVAWSVVVIAIAVLSMVVAAYPWGFFVPALLLAVWVALRGRRRVSGTVWVITAVILGAATILGLAVTFVLTPVEVEITNTPEYDCTMAELQSGSCQDANRPQV